MRSSRVLAEVLLITAVFLLAGAALAQETVHFASVSGRVTDPSGAIVQGARVTSRQTETNMTRTVETDAEGRFRLPYLPLGRHEITVRREGFADASRSVTLTVGAAFELPVSLTVASAEANVTVGSEITVLEGARSQIAGTVPQSEIMNLPLNGRSFLDVALLIPGVSSTNTGSTQLFPETSAAPGQGISVNSQRNFSNSFIVDGLSANDDAAGLSGVFYGLDVVRELQVVTSGGQAEFGRALGGYVSLVTKSGTNQPHGDLYGYFRNQRMNANNALSGTKLPLTQAQYGASLGGPAVRDRTFYFTNFEHRGLNQSGLVTINPANVGLINARLAATLYQGPQIATGQYPNPVHNTNFFAKADHIFSEKDQFSVRYGLYNAASENSRGAGALSAVTAAAGLDNTDQTVAVSNILTLSSRMVNETRAQFTRSNLAAEPNDTVGPSVNISGVASFGRLSGSPTARLNNLFEIADNLSYQRGAHAIRLGADLLYNGTTITYPRSIRGGYSFSSMANFLNGVYNNAGFTQTFGNSVLAQSNPNLSFYVQDEWKLKPRFTLNVGLRYDLQLLEAVATDTNNISPRAGFAWSPFESRSTVVRGSFGLFYDRVPLRAVANALLSSRNTTTIKDTSQVSVSLSPAQAGAPVFPNIIGNLPPAFLVNFTTMLSPMRSAYSVQGSFEIERQLGSRAAISLGYMHLRGLHLLMSVNQNVPACAASGTNNGCRPNPDFANNSRYSPQADSSYNGLHVSILQRPVQWGNYRISYTYSKAFDNVGEFFFSSPIDNFNVWRDWGRSDDDQRHRLVFNGTLQSPSGPARSVWQHLSHDFQFSGMLQYSSALPFNITAGTITIQGTTARPLLNGDFIPRNEGRGFDLFTVSLRLSRIFQLTERIRLQGLVEAFNALNHVNGVTLNGTFGAGAYPTNPLPAFGQTTSVMDPRTFQLALRLTF